MLDSYANYVIRWRWPILALLVLMVLGAASGGRFLGFSSDYRVFFSPDNPQLQAFEELQERYDRADNVLFVLSPKNEEVFTQETLEVVQSMTEKAWQTPYSIRVDSITNFQHTDVEGDDLVVRDLVPVGISLTEQQLGEARSIALDEPLLRNRLINDKGSVTGINVTVNLPGETLGEVPEVAAFARQLAAAIEIAHPDVSVHTTGMVMFNSAFGENTRGDLTRLIPLMFAVVIIGLGILYRSISLTIATTVVLFFSIVTAVGLFGWAGYKLSPPSASAPNIIMTIAVAGSVHFLISFLSGMRDGLEKIAAIKHSLQMNLQPIFLTSLTTCIGFLALNASDVPPIVHLGNIVAIGVVAAFILTVVFLPALVAVLPVRISPRKTRIEGWSKSFSAFVTKRSATVLITSVVVCGGFMSLIPNNEFNDDYVKYFDKTIEFRNDTDYAIAHLIGPNNIQYSLESGVSNGVTDPSFLRQVDEFVTYLESQDEVRHVFSFTDVMKRLNRSMNGGEDSRYELPDEKELAAQYLLLYELSLPLGLDLNNQLNSDRSSTRIGVSFDSLTTAQMLELEDRIGGWLRQNLPDVGFAASSTNLMFSHIGQVNARSMLGSALQALVLISLLLILALKSFKLGVISLVPNLIPIGVAFGVWSLLSGQIGLSLAPVIGMTLGIVVDDTIHFLSKYQRARTQQGLSPAEATEYAFKHVGQALVTTTIVLVLGFSILTLSPFSLNADMGMLAAITIAIALVVDFFLLPSLLIRFDRDSQTANSVELAGRVS